MVYFFFFSNYNKVAFFYRFLCFITCSDDFVNNENSRRYIKPSKHCFARQQEHHNLGTRSDEPLDCVVTYSDILGKVEAV